MYALNLIFILVASTTSPLDKVRADEIRQSVQRSIPFIEAQGVQWIDEKKCVSCHQVNSMVWSLSLAKRQEFEVSDRIQAWLEWAANASLEKNDQGKSVGLGNKEGVAQILYGLNQSGYQPANQRQLANLLRQDQQEDGSWKAGGQLPAQKRDQRETDMVSTMWITLGLMPFSAKDEFSDPVKRATTLIHTAEAGSSTEWYAARLLIAAAEGDQRTKEKWISQLLQHQNDDGGWGWLLENSSDALGTGMAIYALEKAGKNPQSIAMQQGQKFLLSTQQKDGSWKVPGTKRKKRDRIEDTASYWGTTWATLALISCLPN